MPYDRPLPPTDCIRKVLQIEYHPDTMSELRRVLAHCLIRDQQDLDAHDSLERAKKATQRPLS